MATTHRLSGRLKQGPADTLVDRIFDGTDWVRLHAMIRAELARNGYGASTLIQFLSRCLLNEEVRPMLRQLIVPDRSWKRRLKGAPLSASEMERMLAVGEVVREARRLYGGNVEAAEQFLTRPNARFGGQTPILAAATEGGAQAVRELLARVDEGAPV
jgi:putative toxin-antitoxin system antitoxin component (TIGR02293 family)